MLHGIFKICIKVLTNDCDSKLFNFPAVPCPDDYSIPHGVLEGVGHVFPNEASISCNSGYQWKGSTPHAECDSTGAWLINGQCEGGKLFHELWKGKNLSAMFDVLFIFNNITSNS